MESVSLQVTDQTITYVYPSQERYEAAHRSKAAAWVHGDVLARTEYRPGPHVAARYTLIGRCAFCGETGYTTRDRVSGLCSCDDCLANLADSLV